MCGRYTLRSSGKAVAEVFGLAGEPVLLSRFNIAPTQQVPAVRSAGNNRQLTMFRWGLVPSWAHDLAIGNRMINARAESAAEKPAFRSAFKHQRCLVVADGFYEWQKAGGNKQPFYIRMRDEKPFAFAGLWEEWKKSDTVLESCTILTTDANDLVKPLHDRMPVILDPKDYDAWLQDDPTKSGKLLRPFQSEEMTLYPVSTLVNSPRNDGPKCVEAAPCCNVLLPPDV